ncbi:hypothetical protein [Falsiroseomonas sp.]|uniref:hypothetical protein n=1 Tax=Falsiroseomonas sp. TaxID=2870721 RepID=UPI0034A3C789
MKLIFELWGMRRRQTLASARGVAVFIAIVAEGKVKWGARPAGTARLRGRG